MTKKAIGLATDGDDVYQTALDTLIAHQQRHFETVGRLAALAGEVDTEPLKETPQAYVARQEAFENKLNERFRMSTNVDYEYTDGVGRNTRRRNPVVRTQVELQADGSHGPTVVLSVDENPQAPLHTVDDYKTPKVRIHVPGEPEESLTEDEIEANAQETRKMRVR